MNIVEKIKQLGGLTALNNCAVPSSEDVANVEQIWGVILPDDYKKFIIKYGPCLFINNVYFEYGDVYCNIDYFLSPVMTGECSMVELGEQYIDNIHMDNNFYPIHQGINDDLIGYRYDSEKKCMGLYYWNHEGYENENTYYVAETFNDFIEKLHLCEDVALPDNAITKVTVTDEFLALLERDGYIDSSDAKKSLEQSSRLEITRRTEEVDDITDKECMNHLKSKNKKWYEFWK